MKVFKFGGASVRNAEGVKNMVSILNRYEGEMIIVVSAMGKTTNALEEVVMNYFEHKTKELVVSFEKVRDYHYIIINELFGTGELPEIADLFRSLENRILQTEPSLDYDFEYDQIICYGELLSSKIVSLYLHQIGLAHQWIDIREGLRTDDTWREGTIDWELSGQLIPKLFTFSTSKLYLTQGFIAATPFNLTTTLGREGSDYTAAILANIMDAESLAIWKDVPGIMTADPHKFGNTRIMEKISYREAVEMTYFGAKVIHPKTMKPLVDKNIPLYVKSFTEPDQPGSVVHNFDFIIETIPVLISKEDQMLLTISSLDLSFMAEDHIARIYHLLSQFRMKVNLVQQSAMSYSVAIDRPQRNLDKLIQELSTSFQVRYNENLELLTIRNYDLPSMEKMVKGRTIYVEQRTRRTVRFLVASLYSTKLP